MLIEINCSSLFFNLEITMAALTIKWVGITTPVLELNALAVELQRMHDQDRAREGANPDLTCFSLTRDLDHWACYGIYTVDALHAYLDAEDDLPF
jgi:hypothetical protein